MLVIDSHLDLAWSAIEWDRNLDLEVSEIRHIEQQRLEAAASGDNGRLPELFRRSWTIKPGLGSNTLSLPEMHKGELAVCCATVLDRTAHAHSPAGGSACQEISYAKAQGQLGYYRALEAQGKMQMLSDWSSLQKHWQTWERGEEAPLGYILSMEGADPIVWPEQVHSWWQDGLRVASLCHYGASAYAYGTTTQGGVTDLGQALLREMDACGMVLDLSHLADQAFWEALVAFHGPVLASHNNCRALVPGDRQFSDEQIRAIVERDGVIGVAHDAWMLYPGWDRGVTQNDVVGLDALARQIDHVCLVDLPG